MSIATIAYAMPYKGDDGFEGTITVGELDLQRMIARLKSYYDRWGWEINS